MALDAYGYGCILKETEFGEAKARVVDALAKEGFGVLTEIDVRSTLKKKLDLDFRNYLILGACNPQLARKALEADPHAGLLLPCNVVLQDRPETGGVAVSLQNPSALAAQVGNRDLEAVAHEADVRILRVLAALGGDIPKGKEAKLEDVVPLHPEAYPAKGLKARLDARQDMLGDIKEHYPSEGLQDTE
jgi:uncharacterized protein (DUF302 family)